MTKIALELVSDAEIHLYIQNANNLYDYAISKFLPTCIFKWLNPEDFDSKKYSSNTSRECVLETDLECSKESNELHNAYPLVSDKINIKKENVSIQINDL